MKRLQLREGELRNTKCQICVQNVVLKKILEEEEKSVHKTNLFTYQTESVRATLELKYTSVISVLFINCYRFYVFVLYFGSTFIFYNFRFLFSANINVNKFTVFFLLFIVFKHYYLDLLFKII